MEKIGIGLIVGNRSFFPDHLCKEGREKLLKVLKEKFEVITLSEKDTKYGSIENYSDAKKCAELFSKNREKIDGIIVTLPNFGDEKAIADTIKLSGLSVPLLIHAFPDDINKMDVKNRRDSFCGKISVCNVLYQYGIKFTLTENHVVDVESQEFTEDIDRFEKICKVIKGLKNLKLGAIGTRPDAFKTVRYSEKILEKNGISVDVIDLSEIFAKISKIDDKDKKVKEEIEKFKNYTKSEEVPLISLTKFAKLKIVIEDWINQNDIKGIGFQCWTSIEENLGIVPCAVLSYFSNSLVPSACEVDITGTLSMYILQIASGLPSAIVDLNNNYKDEKDKVVLFHCSNFPVSILKKPKISYQEIISESVGKENAYGGVIGQIKKSYFTFLRLSTDDKHGIIKGYIGEGELTDDKLETFGGFGIAKINNLQKLLKFICENGFEHHTVINLSKISDPVEEALTKYKNWSLYIHE
ncbi:MAG: L-fucose/L-arabinose isomerase family protein [bacterium]|nr:L-fucose/L-arabinose isomerase family protein [bacterium]MCX7917170.1 L-fucose/L-arabinose isomerase family protein [bacterium]MDW8164288.1 L-fucose/L-arabinose isomerase family protein [Candidatus Omnitrophota bacterium]